MATPHDHAPAWLFSFVDLAFLLLIALTQLGPEGGGIALDLGEIVVPQVRGESLAQLPASAAQRWQLRVHAPDGSPGAPFELIDPGVDGDPGSSERLDVNALRQRLVSLHDRGAGRPLLAPHENSLSQDLLDAVAQLEEIWSRNRRVTASSSYARR
jgi:hypothetical protein